VFLSRSDELLPCDGNWKPLGVPRDKFGMLRLWPWLSFRTATTIPKTGIKLLAAISTSLHLHELICVTQFLLPIKLNDWAGFTIFGNFFSQYSLVYSSNLLIISQWDHTRNFFYNFTPDSDCLAKNNIYWPKNIF